MKQSDLANDLRAQTEHLVKIGRETSETLKRVADLEEAIRTSGDVSPEVEAALTELKTQAQNVDDLVPDLPASTVSGGTTESTSNAERPTPNAQQGTVVDAAVAQAAQKATIALGEVQEAVQSGGGDVAAALEDLKTAHAELAGKTDADVTEAHGAVTDAAANLESATVDSSGSGAAGEAAAAALKALQAAHNDLITAVSAAGTAEGGQGPEVSGQTGAKGEGQSGEASVPGVASGAEQTAT